MGLTGWATLNLSSFQHLSTLRSNGHALSHPYHYSAPLAFLWSPSIGRLPLPFCVLGPSFGLARRLGLRCAPSLLCAGAVQRRAGPRHGAAGGRAAGGGDRGAGRGAGSGAPGAGAQRRRWVAVIWPWVNTIGIPFWLVGAPTFLVYFSGVLTHSHLGLSQRESI